MSSRLSAHFCWLGCYLLAGCCPGLMASSEFSVMGMQQSLGPIAKIGLGQAIKRKLVFLDKSSGKPVLKMQASLQSA